MHAWQWTSPRTHWSVSLASIAAVEKVGMDRSVHVHVDLTLDPHVIDLKQTLARVKMIKSFRKFQKKHQNFGNT